MTPFDRHLTAWKLVPDGAPIHTHSSDLLPVRRDGEAAMLKIPRDAQEKFGALMMRWWDGDGAARVLAFDEDALLIERACGPRSLSHMARNGRDQDATRILCETINRLHAPRAAPPPSELAPLTQWFADLDTYARSHGGVLARCWQIAQELLAQPREVRPLHADIHHENVLDAGPRRGWIAIDPKRVIGERGYDFANLFTDPDADTALAPGQFERRLDDVVEYGRIERRRLLQWIVAYQGLSAAWFLSDEEEPAKEFAIIGMALAQLDR
ncbi:aminoglycoside phosphotransferase family protein [Lysobacter capsici]|uniref:aminoglycoside phosphotransferase family protein n=1 Tax=Lysobacter capsici TaxID=435897 RepID=UPI00287BB4AC|nr:aminoglycoside phosphotransferase family protein [Lysobacter capsici]WND80723.1 aminoglycoside phosphotransferase family protein [Lysobacter capsici]WND85919.1 aminoglycoside phosphotransferase family protein [Lysobacter capsici]